MSKFRNFEKYEIYEDGRIWSYKTNRSLKPGTDKVGYVREGYAFSPMFTLGYTGKLSDKEVFETWLKLEKAN